MEPEKTNNTKAPWTARRIIALLGIILLLGLYVAAFIFALMDSPLAKGLLMASIYCTIVVPILLFAMIYIARALQGKGAPEEAQSPEEATSPSLHERASASSVLPESDTKDSSS